MWLFTRYGFFSAVCACQGDGEQGQPVDPDLIAVRARSRMHLTSLKKRFPDLLGQSVIRSHAGTDYALRIFVEKAVWTRVLSELAEDLDYGNFKDEVARYQGRAGAEYEDALHDVWMVMRGLQWPQLR